MRLPIMALILFGQIPYVPPVAVYPRLYTEIVTPARIPKGNGLISELNSQFKTLDLESPYKIDDIYDRIRFLIKLNSNYDDKHLYIFGGRYLRANLSQTYIQPGYFRPILYGEACFDQYFTKYFVDFRLVDDLHACIMTCKIARSIHIDYSVYKDRAILLLKYLQMLEQYWYDETYQKSLILSDLVRFYEKELKKL